jgi:hypothetical protein
MQRQSREYGLTLFFNRVRGTSNFNCNAISTTYRSLAPQTAGFYFSFDHYSYCNWGGYLALWYERSVGTPATQVRSSSRTASVLLDIYPQRREHSCDGYVRYIKALILIVQGGDIVGMLP